MIKKQFYGIKELLKYNKTTFIIKISGRNSNALDIKSQKKEKKGIH